MIQFRKNPTRQREIAALSQVLSELSMDAIADYVLLADVAKCPIDASSYSLIQARRHVERRTGMRFETVRGLGIRKMTSTEVPRIGEQARRSIGRKARRQGRRLTHLSYNLGGSTTRQVDAERSLLGAISTLASTPRERVEAPPQTAPTVAERVLRKGS
jgi:hypothetical protein